MSKKGSEARKNIEKEVSLFNEEFTNTVWRKINREDGKIELSKSLKDFSPLKGEEFSIENLEDKVEDIFSESTKKLSSSEEQNLMDEVTQWVNSKMASSQDFSSQSASPLHATEAEAVLKGEGIAEVEVEAEVEAEAEAVLEGEGIAETYEEKYDEHDEHDEYEEYDEEDIGEKSKGESKTIPLRPRMQFHNQVTIDKSSREIKAENRELKESLWEDVESPSTKVLKGDFVDRASAYSPLAQAESLKVAQNHLLDLEKETKFLKEENEELALAGDTLRSRNDELLSQLESLQLEQSRIKNGHSEEMEVVKKHLRQKDKDIKKFQKKIKTLESHLQADLRRVHIRERELENRIEIIKNEHKALLKSKDDNFMELRRKEDRQKMEIENYRKKCQELNQKIILQKEQLARVVRTTRVILTQLEASGMDPDDPDSDTN